MKGLWSRLSAKAKRRIICVAGYAVWIAVFWFAGKAHLTTPAEAFFGLAGLTGVYAGFWVGLAPKLLAGLYR